MTAKPEYNFVPKDWEERTVPILRQVADLMRKHLHVPGCPLVFPPNCRPNYRLLRGAEHGFFVQQNIITAGKLGLSRKVFSAEQLQAEARATAQRYPVLNSVRALYYRALGAQRLVEVRSDLAKIAR